MKEFIVNKFITLRLEEERTVIYVNNKPFTHCKFLLLNIPINEIKSIDEIESIDEAAENLDRSLESGEKEIEISPETEFWGHCSNLQVWYELNYDTRLLHSNIAFPLLKKLTEAGDSMAKRVFKDEIAKRIASGHEAVMIYLIKNDYLKYLNDNEITSLIYSMENPPESILKFLGIDQKISKLIFKLFKIENPVQYIKEQIKNIPINERATTLYTIGINIANVDLVSTDFGSNVDIKKSKDSNVELGVQIMELALELPNCPRNVFEILTHLYGDMGKYNKVILSFEKVTEQNKNNSTFLSCILLAAFYTGRQDLIDKYLDISLKNKEGLKDPFLLSNVIYALNRKETNEASEIALKLTRDYWNKQKKKNILATIWVNMTDSFIVADKIDDTFEEIVNEALKILNRMHPTIYENIAWYYLKKEQPDKAIDFLKKAKQNSHPRFREIKNSKYFISLKDNPDFIKLFK